MLQDRKSTRRQFLKTTAWAAGAVTFPQVIPSSALGAACREAASERIVMGAMAWNSGMGYWRPWPA
jgi:hypothetical protein